jgi:hypothetical protein
MWLRHPDGCLRQPGTRLAAVWMARVHRFRMALAAHPCRAFPVRSDSADRPTTHGEGWSVPGGAAESELCADSCDGVGAPG